jgi:hypothetical protein
MRARNAWIVAGIVVAGAAAAWLALRPGAAPRAASNPDPVTTDDPPATPTRDRNFPHRGSAVSKNPETPEGPRPGTGSAVYEKPETVWGAEARDEAWAEEAEREIAGRMGPLAEPLDVRYVVGCRTTRCAVTVFADTEYALGTVVTRMGEPGEPGGLYGWADQMIVGAVEVADDGSYVQSIYVELERDPTR